MGEHFTAEENKQNHVEKLGDELGSLYHELWNDVVRLHSKWDEFIELFGSKPSRVELLNKSAPLFFRTAQDSLWESTLLHITRLRTLQNLAAKTTSQSHAYLTMLRMR